MITSAAGRVLEIVNAGLVVTTMILVDHSPPGPDGRRAGTADSVATTLMAVTFFGGFAGLALVRRQVYGPAVRGDGPSRRPALAGPPPTDPAIAAIRAARARREGARRIAREDPLMAHELNIGRPDLASGYDDGGLVDLNTAPAEVIASVVGLEHPLAERIVEARGTAGTFLAVDDVLVRVDLPIQTWELLRDRGIVLSI